MTVLRAYTPDECGPDDYPRVWHTGLVPAEDAERGVFVGDYATHIRFEIDPVGTKGVPSVGIKDVVRMLADHRCVRCGHPYRCGAHGNGEWSFCDARCAHAGPVRDTPLGPEANGGSSPFITWTATRLIAGSGISRHYANAATCKSRTKFRWRGCGRGNTHPGFVCMPRAGTHGRTSART
jgi:hypothetical protein